MIITVGRVIWNKISFLVYVFVAKVRGHGLKIHPTFFALLLSSNQTFEEWEIRNVKSFLEIDDAKNLFREGIFQEINETPSNLIDGNRG